MYIVQCDGYIRSSLVTVGDESGRFSNFHNVIKVINNNR
jgi:hypothetical protein